MSGLGISWWITQKGIELCHDIAEMAKLFDPKLQCGDSESFTSLIEDVFQQNALNSELFVDFIFNRTVVNLYEACALEDKKTFALRIWNKIYKTLTDSLVDWLILYPLHRVNVLTTNIGFDDILLFASNDIDRWNQLSKSYANAKYWNPLNGKGEDKDPNVFGCPCPTWLVCEVAGTDLRARKLAGYRMRTFIAALFSHIDEDYTVFLMKSMANEISYACQFSKNGGQVIAHIGGLLPPILKDINLSPAILDTIKQWYSQRSSADVKIAKRATRAAQFVHYGIMLGDIEIFIHFFISLDALFGERGKVEQMVIGGIKQTFKSNSIWVEKAKLLFDLRSELVHGGASSIEEWKDIQHYKRRFKTKPLDDISIAAMTALRNYFNLMANRNKNIGE